MLLLALVGPGFAQATDLYTGEYAVADGRSADTRAFSGALEEVLVKLTGHEELARDPALSASIGDPEAHMLGFQFREYSVPMREGEPLEERRLVAEFDPDRIDRILAEQAIPRWGRERPEMLVWTVFETLDGSVEFGEAESDWLDAHLEEAGRRRGLSLVTPLYDGMDRSLASTEDIRGAFSEYMLDAMPRYGTDGVVLVDFRETAAGWLSNWTIRLGQQEERFVLRDLTPEPMVVEGVTRLARFLAGRFATLRGVEGTRERIRVTGIRGTAHFAEIQRYLEELSLVDSVHLRRARGEAMDFELELNASGLEHVLEIGGLLEFRGQDGESGYPVYDLQW